jgi:hypothetical protein
MTSTDEISYETGTEDTTNWEQDESYGTVCTCCKQRGPDSEINVPTSFHFWTKKDQRVL